MRGHELRRSFGVLMLFITLGEHIFLLSGENGVFLDFREVAVEALLSAERRDAHRLGIGHSFPNLSCVNPTVSGPLMGIRWCGSHGYTYTRLQRFAVYFIDFNAWFGRLVPAYPPAVPIGIRANLRLSGAQSQAMPHARPAFRNPKPSEYYVIRLECVHISYHLLADDQLTQSEREPGGFAPFPTDIRLTKRI